MTVEAIRAAALEGVPHGFLGRRGGVSTGICYGLNVGLGSGDDPEAIRSNRALALEAVAPGTTLATIFQIHSAEVVTVTSSYLDEARPRADAMVTDRHGLALGILTADCAPILFADRAAGVIGAAHAGWKGALGGVGEATVAAMERLGASRASIVAAIGPCISRKSYEVDDAFLAQFTSTDAENERFFNAGKAGRHQFDLEAFNLSRLAAAGLARVEALGQDTYSQPDLFFSYRRATHRSEPDYGRQIALIALPG